MAGALLKIRQAPRANCKTIVRYRPWKDCGEPIDLVSARLALNVAFRPKVFIRTRSA